jgi:hypothetical protein
MNTFSFISNHGNRKVGWVGYDTDVFGPKFPGEKGNVRLFCNSQRVCPQSLRQSLLTFSCNHSSMQNWLFGLPRQIVCKQSPWCQRKWWAYSWLSSSSVSVSLDFFFCMVHAFFPKHLSNHCQDLLHTLPEICTKSYAVALLDALRNHFRPNTQFQINGCKNQHIHLTAWNFEH